MSTKLVFQIASDIHIEKYPMDTPNPYHREKSPPKKGSPGKQVENAPAEKGGLSDTINEDLRESSLDDIRNNSPSEDEDAPAATRKPLMTILDFIEPSAPNLILAGDIGSAYHTEHLSHFLRSCKASFETVIYIAGNNEYYLRRGYQLRPLHELEETIKNICNEAGVYYLNNSYIETDTHIIFGSTWWSKIDTDPCMNILYKDHTINSDDFSSMHYTSRIALNTVIALNKTLKKKLVVITHYCPTKIGTMSNSHKRDDFASLVPYYFSASEQFLNRGDVDTWIYGHTHLFRDFMFEGTHHRSTRIVSNADPRKKFFRKNFVIEV